MSQQLQIIKAGLDVAASTTVVATLMGYLPSIAAGCAIVWFLIQLGDWLLKPDTWLRKLLRAARSLTRT